MVYSVIVPVFNRPEETDELLNSLTRQSFNDFEVLIIEDGSDNRCDKIVDKYRDLLNIRYFYKENSGQGYSRNYGFERAKGDYFVVFDSDCLIPAHYFAIVNRELRRTGADCWGGPDRAHASFNPVQRAINYAMTSPFTTGGIRGRKRSLEKFRPRSFNMGISREVYEKTGGYRITRMGEDIEFSIRIEKAGFKSILIPDAYVYHKRRTDFGQFYRQLHFFGRARINISRFYPDELKGVHLLPALFILGIPAGIILLTISPLLGGSLLLLYPVYAALLLLHSQMEGEKLATSFLAISAAFIQLSAYGIGMMEELSKKNTESG
ncbi:MAG: glycosyltransferase [Balneolaceae bacterium]|nr:glycosyltransferase [Balneolaceae bacterium]MCH8547543.1 glycosyltransferase [Balneolaceae bacterium]